MAQTDYWYYQVYFSGCPINHIPKGITLPDQDKTSRAIINAIFDRTSFDQLKQRFPDSLDIKLEKLIQGGVIEKDGKGFKLLFPVIVGEKRAELQRLIHEQLITSDISIDAIIIELQKALKDNPEMTFHFLWSRVLDDCWWGLYNSTFKTEEGPPAIAFIVYPPHPYQCGTNSDYTSDNDMFAVSWSYNIFDILFRTPSTTSFFDLAKNSGLSSPDRDFFSKHGLLDSNDNSLIFTYYEDDPLDRLCDSLKAVYISETQRLFDYEKLSRMFDIPADDLFILVSHEVAYELLAIADNKSAMFFPIIIKNNPDLNFKYLLSIRFHKRN